MGAGARYVLEERRLRGTQIERKLRRSGDRRQQPRARELSHELLHAPLRARVRNEPLVRDGHANVIARVAAPALRSLFCRYRHSPSMAHGERMEITSLGLELARTES
jgi:hypothetical protein